MTPYFNSDKLLGHWDGEFHVEVQLMEMDDDETPSQAAVVNIINPFSKDSFGWIIQEDVDSLIKSLQAASKLQKKTNKALGWK